MDLPHRAVNTDRKGENGEARSVFLRFTKVVLGIVISFSVKKKSILHFFMCENMLISVQIKFFSLSLIKSQDRCISFLEMPE